MKKIICLLMALLMLVVPLSACGDKTEDPAATTEAKTEAETSPYLDHLPELDFEEREVNIFYSVYDPSFDAKGLELEGDATSSADFIAQAVFARNEEVQDRLNIVLGFTSVDSNYDATTYATKIESTIIHTQSTEFDLIYHRAANAVVHANSGYFKAVNALPYVDWNQSYWFYDQMEAISLNKNQLYVIMGDALVSNYSNMTSMFFNIDLFTTLFPDRDPAELYDVVKNNEWTWEYYFDLISQCYRDNDGESGVTAKDIYGSNWENGTRTVQYFPYTSGLKFTERDDNGFPRFTLNNQRTDDMVSKLYGYIYENEGTVKLTKDEATTKFLDGSLLFFNYFLSLGKMISQTAEFEYGILPFPKYDSLSDYTSAILTGAGVFVIPYTITEEERLNCIGATLEALCSSNAKRVVPEYWETVLKVKQSGTPQNMEMIQFIRDHLTFDVSFWMSNSLGKVASTFQECIIKSTSNNYSATWDRLGSTYESALQSLITKYNTPAA